MRQDPYIVCEERRTRHRGAASALVTRREQIALIKRCKFPTHVLSAAQERVYYTISRRRNAIVATVANRVYKNFICGESYFNQNSDFVHIMQIQGLSLLIEFLGTHMEKTLSFPLFLMKLMKFCQPLRYLRFNTCIIT